MFSGDLLTEREAGSCPVEGGSVEWVEMTAEESLQKNPLVPDSGRYWCYRCKAHNGFDHIIKRTSRARSNDTYEKMSCVRCQASMFNPARTKPVMYGFLGITLVALLFALALWRDYEDYVAGCLGFAAFFGLIGFMKLYYMNLWWSWARLQKAKSPEQLEEEGRQYIVSFKEVRK